MKKEKTSDDGNHGKRGQRIEKVLSRRGVAAARHRRQPAPGAHPPLDGGRIVSGLLPYRAAAAFDRIEPYGMIILLVLMVGGGLSFFVRPFLMFGQMVVELLI